MFQFATGSGVIISNTGLISLDEAKQLWRDHKAEFISYLKAGDTPEMTIWINCIDGFSYHETLWFVNSDSLVKNGRIYNLVEQGRDE